MDPTLSTSHILCLNETRIQNIIIHKNIHDAIVNNNNILSCYDQHGTMILYDKMVLLSNTTSKTNVGA
jgi:hypothetical protein